MNPNFSPARAFGARVTHDFYILFEVEARPKRAVFAYVILVEFRFRVSAVQF